jgi:hypothetical protein
MKGLYGEKISKHHGEKLRSAYRATHPYCWRAVWDEADGVWRFCGGDMSLEVNEIAHGNNRIIHPSNFIMYCGYPGGRCHHGIFHREDNPEQSDARLMLEALAVKVMFGETTYDEVTIIMNGRQWWTEDMGREATVVDACQAIVEERKSLLLTEMPRWQMVRKEWGISAHLR